MTNTTVKKTAQGTGTPRTSQADVERSDWEGMGQGRFTPEEPGPDAPMPSGEPSTKRDGNKPRGGNPTPGANSLAAVKG